MYVPPAFREDDLAALHGMMREVRLANLVTATVRLGASERASDRAVVALIPG